MKNKKNNIFINETCLKVYIPKCKLIDKLKYFREFIYFINFVLLNNYHY